MPMKVGNIELYMGPHQVGGDDDLLDTIVRFIDGAEKRLYIAVQELDSRPIAEAIIRAKQRKVTVKLVLEADYLRAKRTAQDPFETGGPHEKNRALHDAVLRANIKVNSDYNPQIFHQKFMVRDSESVLTGSTNFTEYGTTENLNHIVIVHDAAVARIFSREFTEIQQGHFGKLNEGHDPRPQEVMVSQLRVKTLFAPDHNPEMEIMKQIAKARSGSISPSLPLPNHRVSMISWCWPRTRVSRCGEHCTNLRPTKSGRPRTRWPRPGWSSTWCQRPGFRARGRASCITS